MNAINEIPAATPIQTTGKKFSIRALSYIIDLIAINILTLITVFFCGIFYTIFYMIANEGYAPYPQFPQIFNYLIGFVILVIYFAIFEWLFGASLGKLALRMRVVMLDGSPCTLKAAMIRGLLRLVDGFFFGLIAYKTMKPPLYKRIGDISAKTLVVDAHDPLIQQKLGWWRFLVALVIFEVFLSGETFLELLLAGK